MRRPIQTVDRDALIVRLYSEGTPAREIGARPDVLLSHQGVLNVLKANNAPIRPVGPMATVNVRMARIEATLNAIAQKLGVEVSA